MIELQGLAALAALSDAIDRRLPGRGGDALNVPALLRTAGGVAVALVARRLVGHGAGG
jgi:hypothetical protein